MTRHPRSFQALLVSMLVGVSACFPAGCATLAHRSSCSYKAKETVTSCDRNGTVCPWLIGDALLLLPGIVPGVIAFVVDFGTGAWRHESFPASPSSPEPATVTAATADAAEEWKKMATEAE